METYTNYFSLYQKEFEKLLSRDETLKLLEEYKEGNNKAYETLLLSNIKLVIFIARKYINKGISLEDLVQEGIIGLMKAIQKFDPAKETEFSTYATWWIRQAITRALAEKARTIKIPVYLWEKQLRYFQAIKELEKTLGKEPSKKELSEFLSISEKELLELELYILPTISLDEKLNKEESKESFEFYVKDNSCDIEEEVINKNKQKEIKQCILAANLTKQEKIVLNLRYNLEGEKTLTLKEIGKRYNLSHQRVLEIEQSAIKKIRKSKKAMSYLLENEEDFLLILKKNKSSL